MWTWIQTLSGLSLVALALAPLILVHPLQAQAPGTITGRVVNGTEGSQLPPGLEVTLFMVDDSGSSSSFSTTVDPDGSFQFQELPVDNSLTYLVTVRYQDVTYSLELDAVSISTPADLTVYEVASDISTISLDSIALIVGWAIARDRVLGILERVKIRNSDIRTFVPDLESPGGMNFLRFSLPPSYTNLRVQANLAEGQVVPIDQGFALTTSVPPGIHELLFTYLLPYPGKSVEFTRTFPFSTDAFLLMMPEGLGQVRAPALAGPEMMQVGESAYLSLEAMNLKPKSSLTIELYDLPQPTLLQRGQNAIRDGLLRILIIPGLLGLILAGVLAYLMLFGGRRPARVTPGSPEGRDALIEAIARLDDLFRTQEIREEEYTSQRAQLKARLLQLTDQEMSEGHEGRSAS